MFLNSVPEVEKVDSETGDVDFLSRWVPEDDENNTENVENIEFEDADSKPDLPIDYEKKLGEEDEEEIEEPFLKRNIKKTITYLDGKSLKVVSGTLILFSINIINFCANRIHRIY